MSSGARRLVRCSLSVRRPRWSITTQRTCAGCSRAPATGARQRYPDAPGRRMEVFELKETKPGRCMSILVRTPETKRPRDLRPEGVRVASGDRGGRSPRENRPLVGVPLAFEARITRAQIRAAGWPQGKQIGVGGGAVHWNSLTRKNAEQGPKAAHDTRVVFRMQQLFYKDFEAEETVPPGFETRHAMPGFDVRYQAGTRSSPPSLSASASWLLSRCRQPLHCSGAMIGSSSRARVSR
ncbi:hypothetical protein SAMN06296058_1407 [Pseudoxanthomonas indica]|uniref:Uncharacterized protein n=1 Tax=Pseudoxanthomonas indica TaxID=428993 RepID=A0A1T5K6G0_9GAMM|nr:hypothetical protein SAMN06296058_1407 [Pseudoxanthomonas indica]